MVICGLSYTKASSSEDYVWLVYLLRCAVAVTVVVVEGKREVCAARRAARPACGCASAIDKLTSATMPHLSTVSV